MDQSRPDLKIEQNIRHKVLWPLGLFIVATLAIFIFSSHSYMERGMSRNLEATLQTLNGRYHNYMQERSGLMRSLLQQLRRDTVLLEALDRQDRSFLLDRATPLFNELLTEQNITHFYFHTPEGVNLLRVHKPDRYGDIIDRVTLHQAQRTNTIADGIELGPLGTFTLRVVMPVHFRSKLIGFIELGEDIDPILDHLVKEGEAKMAILIQKRFLDREAWLEGRKMLGASGEWDLLPQYVVGGISIPGLTDYLPLIATEEAIVTSQPLEVLIERKIHRGQFLNMMDVAGRPVGSLLVLQDVDQILKDHNTSAWLIAAFCFLLASALFLIAFIILGRADQNLKLLEEQLAKELKGSADHLSARD